MKQTLKTPFAPAAVAGNCVDFPTKIKGQELLEVDAADPEEVAEFVDDDPMYEYAVTVEATSIKLDPSTPVEVFDAKVPLCEPGACTEGCICA